jgi:hypothetical protein
VNFLDGLTFPPAAVTINLLRRKGIAPSTTTIKKNGTVVNNIEVVDEIKKIVS